VVDATAPTPANGGGRRGWTFITNHAAVLILVAENPDIRVVKLAEKAGLTPRAVQMIMTDLEAAGYVTRQRVGRSNRYQVHDGKPLRHRTVSGRARIADLLATVARIQDDV
jgi:DNA-binding MarR family transcriptional regulator